MLCIFAFLVVFKSFVSIRKLFKVVEITDSTRHKSIVVDGLTAIPLLFEYIFSDLSLCNLLSVLLFRGEYCKRYCRGSWEVLQTVLQREALQTVSEGDRRGGRYYSNSTEVLSYCKRYSLNFKYCRLQGEAG